MKDQHTFAVCAYRESAYLEECVQSLLAQTLPSTILIATSTPNDHIKGIADKYGIPLHVNEGEAGITGDWNFARSCATTPFVTIAHQDDVYDPTFTEETMKKATKAKRPILVFTDYFEVRNGERVYKNKLLRIKRFLNFGFKLSSKSRFIRRRVLSLGNAICCPAVTFSSEACRDFTFDKSFRFACDWDAWERLSKKKGAFLYVSKPLMGHRIHEESETTKLTAGDLRGEEEFRMFRRFWPAFIAGRLAKSYKKGADSNQL